MDEAIRSKPGSSAGSNQRPRRVGFSAGVMIAMVRGYQVVLGPLLGGRCRFNPSCSYYGIEALRVHGALRGGWLTVRRVCRCHPWGGCGHDPVPPKTETPVASGPVISSVS